MGMLKILLLLVRSRGEFLLSLLSVVEDPPLKCEDVGDATKFSCEVLFIIFPNLVSNFRRSTFFNFKSCNFEEASSTCNGTGYDEFERYPPCRLCLGVEAPDLTTEEEPVDCCIS